MSDEAVAVVRELCDAMEAADWERSPDALDPDVVLHGTRGGIDEGRVIRGREAVVDYWREVVDAWEGLGIEVERLIDAGDLVVALWRETAKSRHSEVEIQSEIAVTFRVRDGRIVEARGYMDRDEALRAANLAT